MKILVELRVTFDRNALNERSEHERVLDLNHDELRDEIVTAISGFDGIENVAGVEIVSYRVSEEVEQSNAAAS